MLSRGLLLACGLLWLPAAAAHAEWDGVPAHSGWDGVPAGLTPPVVLRLPAPAKPPIVVDPLPIVNATPIAASACYAGPVSCALSVPRQPGVPCHCRSRYGDYWGSTR